VNQMMLTVGAMVLLGTAILSMNNGFTQSGDVITDSKLGVTAVSLASSMIEEASGKAFDQKTDTSAATAVSQLTTVAKLGLDAGEFYPDSITDFDDFNNLNITRSFTQGGTFNIRCTVQYIDPSTPDVASSSQTWHKKLSVFVSSPQMTDTIKEYYIFSYWYFR
jgi:hypothetical protein